MHCDVGKHPSISDGWKGQGTLENLDCWLKQVVGNKVRILSDGGCTYCTKFAANASTLL